MYTQKSINIVTLYDGERYKVDVTQTNYISLDKPGEKPSSNTKSRSYLEKDLNSIQIKIEKEFEIEFSDFDELFSWFWG